MSHSQIYIIIISVIFAVGARIAYQLKYGKVRCRDVFIFSASGAFVAFVVYFLITDVLNKPEYLFVAVPFSAYSAVYVLDFWHTDSPSILKSILNHFIKSKSDENESD